MWLKIIGPLVALGIAFSAGWTVASWRASGKIERAEATATAAELESATVTGERNVCVVDLAKEMARLTAMTVARDDLQIEYDKAIARPPERVTVYRDRWREVPTAITSEDCGEGLGQLFAFIGSLPTRGVRHETPN